MRRLVQEGHLWTPKELLQERMIDYLVEPRTDGSSTSQRVLQKALEVAESRCGDARSGVYGLIKVWSASYSVFLVILVVI